MKEIFHNDYFHIRTEEQQEIINLICDNFPSSGFPRSIYLLDDLIAIPSHLDYIAIGYRHSEFEYGKKTHRICFYKKSDFSLIFKKDLEYCVNSILRINDKILLGTGVYGEQSNGELFKFDLATKNFRSCTGKTNAISSIRDSNESFEVFTYFPTGYHEGENRIYKFDKNSDLKIDFSSTTHDRSISDEELEQMYDGLEDTVTIDYIKKIIDKNY